MHQACGFFHPRCLICRRGTEIAPAPAEIALTQGELRATHLKYHLSARSILNDVGTAIGVRWLGRANAASHRRHEFAASSAGIGITSGSVVAFRSIAVLTVSFVTSMGPPLLSTARSPTTSTGAFIT
jgi:hypothetical protein